MIKLFYLLPFLISFSLTGCQSALNVFDKTGTQYERGLQHTKVKTIVFNNETKAIINATYLNSIDSKKWDNENQNFLVGIYIANDAKDESQKFINNPRYKLLLNNKEFIQNTIFTKNEKSYKYIPLKNPWARYYIVSYKKTNKNSETLKLKYVHSIFGQVTLPFEEE